MRIGRLELIHYCARIGPSADCCPPLACGFRFGPALEKAVTIGFRHSMNGYEHISASCPGNIASVKRQLPADTFTRGIVRYLEEITRQSITGSATNELGIQASSRLDNTSGGASKR